MTDTQVSTELLTVAEFIKQYEQQPFELIHGERIILTPVVSGHNAVGRTLNRALDNFTVENGIGEVFYETPFVLAKQRKWVKGSRVPDLLFISAERWNAYVQANPDWRKSPLMIVPDLVVEIVSES